MFTEDLTPLFADMAVPAVYNGQTATVLLDMQDENLFEGAQQSREYAITYRAVDLAGLKKGDAITVNTVAYTVREPPDTLDDGALMRARLRK